MTAPRPYIRLITSNLKLGPGEGTSWTQPLSRLTLIVGPNGSGKSRITQAVEQFLSQSCSDVAGRAIAKSKGQLARMAPPDNSLFTLGTWATSRPDVAFSVDTLVLRPVLAAAVASDTKAYEQLIQWCARDMDRPTLSAYLAAEGLDPDTYLSSDRLGAPVRQLLRAWATANSDRRTALKMIKTFEVTATVMQQRLACLPGDSGRTVEAALSDYISCSGSTPAISPEEMEALVEAVTLIVKHDTERLSASQALTSALTEGAHHAQLAADAKVKVDALKQVMAAMVADLAPAFCAQVQQYLPPGRTFHLNTSPFRLGLKEPGSARALSALSGAEWVMVTSAVAAATTSPSHPAVIIPQDRAWDPDTLERVMRALATFPGQVLLTSTIHPTQPVPGWDTVNVARAPRGT